MKLTKEEFSRIKTVQNHVLIKPNYSDGTYKLPNGKVLYLTANPDQADHFSVTGEVIALPEKIVSNGHKDNMHWGTDVEVQVGDTVWCNYFNVMDMLGKLEHAEDFVLTCEGVDYIPLNYSYIYAAKRGDKIIPLNGYALIEPVVNYMQESTLIVPDHLKTKESKRVGLIRHMGLPNKWYYGEGKVFDKKCSGDESAYDQLSVDELVVIREHKDIFLEPADYESIDGSRKLWRVQYRDLLATLPSNEAVVSDVSVDVKIPKI
jgi:hypothetical protein